ncbi:ribosome recycling factor [Catenisphaera adipataccumulans]|jgi:ribosome recycling factor|uniref:Ribosome-recycling factor n=1 Tax=Catenisphaera adipataccumulans TaxID=700500 RepID=A0A7W8CYE7_9FIRM|nr:ribosome recycling factor [Catenisphaera adipataccumulans]MBB5183915.1 ribosome recycling factor [Catenisphaera adipataccumulans]
MSDYLDEAEMRMMSTIENLESNLHTLHTGHANAGLLDGIAVDYYGAPTPINQMAQIKVVEGTQLVVRPYDRSIVKEATHAIAAANIGLNPQNEGDQIRINVPQLTEERRKELAKKADKFGEEAKVAIRNIRRDTNDQIKKDKELREDEEKGELEDSQKLTDKYVKEVGRLVDEKKKDILNV